MARVTTFPPLIVFPMIFTVGPYSDLFPSIPNNSPIYSLIHLPRHIPFHSSSRYHLLTWPIIPTPVADLYPFMLTLLSPLSCTILRLVPVVAGLSQALLVFNHS